ncbi:PPE family protein, SVP subgroup [Candidatus Mycobacterium methanotrophicum]|uniref:PPE domain-containing protein n=1 Tax=Candidatus Mycobacterium methanotrophicum TaxID=2943498 RepID=A0ABY4QJW4_9MYCO|nr:PPE domain-containing protein [Candidatus Mycobacterium methanotrophicum]UQX10104.1 PPE domain-containing protein [Candidatus Mycobacterium methanotrophicum]
MDFAMIPPEINSARMYAGTGSGPMLAAAAAWDGLAIELHAAATSYQTVIAGLTNGPWLGSSSAAMAAAAASCVTWLNTTATMAERTGSQAKAAAAAFETAFASTVPPTVIAANRSLLTALVATNLFGQNTPAIAATEIQYAEMWAQDAVAMYGYAGSSASATMLTPFTPPAPTTRPSALAGQAATVGQSAGTSATTNTSAVLSQLTSAAPTVLQEFATGAPWTSAAPLATSGLAGILESLGLTSPLTYAGTGLAGSELATASGAWASASDADNMIIGTHFQLADTHEFIATTLDRINGVEGQILNRLGQVGPVGAVGSAVSAGMGEATSVGALSIPLGWTTAAPAIKLAAAALPAASPSVALEAFAANPGSLFGQMALASVVGQTAGNAVSPGRRARINVNTGDCGALPKRAMNRELVTAQNMSPRGPATGIAAEMREVAEVLRDLGALRDCGILSAEEFSEQKRRLLSR